VPIRLATYAVTQRMIRPRYGVWDRFCFQLNTAGEQLSIEDIA